MNYYQHKRCTQIQRNRLLLSKPLCDYRSRNQQPLRAPRTPISMTAPLCTMNVSTRPPSLVNHWLCFTWFWTLYKWANTVCVHLWLAFFFLLLDIRFVNSVHALCVVVAYVIGVEYSTVWIFIHSTVNGHVDCFQSFPASHAAMHSLKCVFRCIWACMSLRYHLGGYE